MYYFFFFFWYITSSYKGKNQFQSFVIILFNFQALNCFLKNHRCEYGEGKEHEPNNNHQILHTNKKNTDTNKSRHALKHTTREAHVVITWLVVEWIFCRIPLFYSTFNRIVFFTITHQFGSFNNRTYWLSTLCFAFIKNKRKENTIIVLWRCRWFSFWVCVCCSRLSLCHILLGCMAHSCSVYFLFYSLRLASDCIRILNRISKCFYSLMGAHAAVQYEAIACSTIIWIASALRFGTVSMVTTRKHNGHCFSFYFFQRTANMLQHNHVFVFSN